MLGRKLTLVKENSFTRQAQQSHLDNGGLGRGAGTYTETGDKVSENDKIIAGVQP